MVEKKYYQISTLQRGFEVLELLARKNSLKVSELARELGINRSAGHRFLATLEEMGYVDKTRDKRYYPTFKILQIGMQVANNVPLREVARPFLQEVASRFKENVSLGYWDGHRVVHLDKIESPEILRIDPSIGSIALGHCTALGKSIMAYLSLEEQEVYIRANGLKRFTDKTITTRGQLDEELARIRSQGYAVDDEELSVGLRCVASSAIDYTGHICFAISVAALQVNMPDERIQDIQKELKRICQSLSAKLGAPEE
ncbi:MAG: IclR family transcriptional regulator [Desulfohalobiaceae bacterium]|nr:IclR family transcriptional regulator [Desulfohalobiaceae bacterium]